MISALLKHASASAYEVDRGDRPGRHQRWTRTRAVSSVTGSRRTTMSVLPPCSRSGSKTALQAAHRPAWVPWRISDSPLIHQMKCYTKSLKYQAESVRPQFLSLRQVCPFGTFFFAVCGGGRNPAECGLCVHLSEPRGAARKPILGRFPSLSGHFSDATEPCHFGTDVGI